ncbi:large ribosomal subunit protein mL52 [Buteo buteo]|uniref:large ribosomal subunit protein mL52 n=1 Tax=Buteo buteo TaxID=30397 RepID=UPI003EB70288
MAARKIMRMAERQARSLRPLPRPAQRIGQWRVAQGFAPSTAGYGPLRDLPDWSFVDGRPAPLWKGQLRRLEENEALARRAVKLSRILAAAAERGEPRGVPPPACGPRAPSAHQYRPVQTSKKTAPPPTPPPPPGSGGGAEKRPLQPCSPPPAHFFGQFE